MKKRNNFSVKNVNKDNSLSDNESNNLEKQKSEKDNDNLQKGNIYEDEK